MKAVKNMSTAELAGYVSSHLRTKDITVVLSGGACVSIYSKGKYVSMDLDLVNARHVKRAKIRKAMEEIGFKEDRRYFRHPNTDYLIEFPPGPVCVGEEPVKQIVELRVSTGILRIISPTDCVKDRLAAYYHWNDSQCLEQAVMVAGTNKVDLGEIKRWSQGEGKLDEFKCIKNRLQIKVRQK